jgi:hypothetical protein
LEEAKTHAVEIRDGDEVLGAIVSKEDYEIVRQARIDRLMQAMAGWAKDCGKGLPKRVSLWTGWRRCFAERRRSCG